MRKRILFPVLLLCAVLTCLSGFSQAASQFTLQVTLKDSHRPDRLCGIVATPQMHQNPLHATHDVRPTNQRSVQEHDERTHDFLDL